MPLLDFLRPRRWPSLLADLPPAADGQTPPDQRFLDRLIPGVDYPISTTPIEEIPLYSFSGWRQPQVQAALDAFEVGSMFFPHQMWLAMLRDPVISHGTEGRVTALVDADFEWRKPPDLPQSVFDEWVARWPDAFDENELASALRLRIGLGLAPAQCVWTIGGPFYWLRRVRVLDTGNLTWFPTERRYKIVTMNAGQQAIEDDCDPWMLFQERAASYPHLHAAARAVAVHWWLKSEAERLEALYGRRCGNPIWKVSGPVEQRSPTDDRNDFKRLVTMAQRMLGNGVFEALKFGPEMKTGFDLDFVEAKGEAHRVFDVIIERADTYFTLKFLGAIDNTQGGRDGSRARADVHEKQSNKYLGGDGKLMDRARYRIARKWCRFNRFPLSWAPIPHSEVNPPEDQKDLADVRLKYAQALGVLADRLPALQGALTAQSPQAKISVLELLKDHQIPVDEPAESGPGLDPVPAPSPRGEPDPADEPDVE